ncbi:MAG: glycosyltransferase family 4 protein [Candidatus Aegiribacteria sp.]|nr:glycosyltransferase family 4 protein [Candidatus Aegiribacteria sp.]
MKQLAIVHASHDGITTHHCGVGTMVHEHLVALKWILESSSGLDFSVYAVTLDFQNSTSNHEGFTEFTSKLCRESNGKLLSCGPPIQERWPSPEKWHDCSNDLSGILADISCKYERVLAFCHDGPFSYSVVERYPDNVFVYWIPHSTSKTNVYDEKGTGISQIEAEVIKGVYQSSAKIVCISPYMRQHLLSEYEASPSSLIDVENGLSMFNFRHEESLSPQVIFMSGRCAPYKRMLEVLEAFRLVRQQLTSFQLVLHAIPDMCHKDYYREVIAVAKAQSGVTTYSDFSTGLPAQYYSHKSCTIALSAARSEPFGLAPLEARASGLSTGPLILVPDEGGLACQVTDSVDGYRFPATSGPGEMANVMIHAICRTHEERKELVRNGRYRAIKRNWLLPNIVPLLNVGRFYDQLAVAIDAKRREYIATINRQ